MSKITANNETYVGKISYETLMGMISIPQWLQPYLKYNGVYVGTEAPTDPEMLVWINPEGVGEDFVTQEEMEKYVKDSMTGGVSLDDYYTKDETNNEIETAIQGIDFTPYATKVELEQYDTSHEVDAKIAAIEIPETDLTGYAKETWVTEQIGNIEIPEVDFTGYAKETWVTEQLTPYAKKTEIPDVSNFATKSEIPSLDGYATENYVSSAISTALNNIGVAEEGVY